MVWRKSKSNDDGSLRDACNNVYQDTKNGIAENDVEETRVGKLKLSYVPADVLILLFGDSIDDMTMLNSFEAQKLIEFLQKYIDSFKK